jgi:hypothetical protein
VTTEHSAPSETDPSGDKQAILDDIDRTRGQLGETVEALAAKADVKARAEQKAAALAGSLREKVAAPVVGQVSRVKQSAVRAWDQAPQPVQRQAKRAAATVQAHRGQAAATVALAVAVATVLAGRLAARKLRRR